MKPTERMARGYADGEHDRSELTRRADAYRDGDDEAADRLEQTIDRAAAAGRPLGPSQRLTVGYLRSAADAHHQLDNEGDK